jgi:hypothetical protein
MPHTISKTPKPSATSEPALEGIRKKIALSMIGRMVGLVNDAHTIVHGVVTGVRIESGTPKIEVAGRRFSLNQILTITPVFFN